MAKPPHATVSSPGFGNSGNDLRRQAQAPVDQARQLSDRRRRGGLARQALNLSPDCAGAYLLLAEQTRSSAEALEFCRQGVAAGERVLGPNILRKQAGYFWTIIDTRPYMRARAGLAQALWHCGYPDQALGHWHGLLKLNPNDHQGIRYLIATRLLELGRDRELEAFLQQYANDRSAYLTWVAALALFRAGGDSIEARRALNRALASNAQVPVYLLAQQPLPRMRPGYIGRGDTSEASAVAAENLNAWRATPGARAWLTSHINA